MKRKHTDDSADIHSPLYLHRPKTRRDFLAQGFTMGSATVLGGSVLSLMAPNASALDPNVYDLIEDYLATNNCNLNVASGARIPFMCFDLAGGASIAGSNVLVGQQGGQEDFLSEAGYSLHGVLQDRVPNNGVNNTIDRSLGLAFHSDSAMLAGMLERMSPECQALVNGCVIPARSENDTANNPHNPLYGIYQAGARGSLLNLIGNDNSVSGGRSMAPTMMIDPEIRPTKISSVEDVRGLVDVGDLSSILNDPNDVVSVMERMASITKMKLDVIDPGLSATVNNELRARILCEYMRAADTYQKFSDPSSLDVLLDTDLYGGTGIFDATDFSASRDYEKTAAVMKLVLDGGRAGAGCVSFGGYDYHNGARTRGEEKDLLAGRCIGASLEYAHRKNTPVMIYVFSDGGISSNGMVRDDLGETKPLWQGDNQQTAASFFMVYNPTGRPTLNTSVNSDPNQHQQLGWMRQSGTVETSSTPAANSVNQLVNMVILNYMALNDDISGFLSTFPNNGLGNPTDIEQYVAFNPIV